MNTFTCSPCLLQRCRNRFVRALQVAATGLFCFAPLPVGRAAWSDADLNGSNDTWTNPQTSISYTLAELDTIALDIDGDNAYNSEELAYGSNPQDFDSDDDGLDDGVEIHQAIELSSKDYSLTNWDSNSDGVSDHDDFYGYTGVTYSGGVLPSFAGATYSDYDGDGVKNPFDSYPTDPLNNDADQDGINDDSDPVLNDATNTSTANGQAWGGAALGDGDGDAILNFWDAYPADASNGSSDSDNDGISNNSDPFPDDHSNYSSLNSSYWYSDVLGDADSDNVVNHADQWPYDSNNGNTTTTDTDADDDGIDDSLDPAPNDTTNYSSANATAWYALALEDQDNDGSSNFNDPYPQDTYNGLSDFDGDNVPNEDDPFPKDSSNYSSLNQTNWYATLFDDPDSDNLANWQDEFPSDTYNNNPDFDGDSFSNGEDPFPKDAGNYSTVNGISWGSEVLGDADSDNTPNWNDSSPYPEPDTDADDDGIADDADPYDNDPTNYSSTNSTAWYSNVLGNNDSDSYLNWEDAWPDDPLNGYNPDRDGDGIANEQDPAPDDYSNYSTYNWVSWYSNALGDGDNDGTQNFWDYQPYTNPEPNWDGDAYLDINDPAVYDYYNFSSTNATSWYNDALGDADGDGTTNFYDDSPYGTPPPPDNDQDGLKADEETTYSTSDDNRDCDGDGLTDGEEVHIFATSPTNKHHLSQQRFSNNLYTDWQLVDLTDTDGDLIPDRIELHYGLNPEWDDDALHDRDNNGINNLLQFNMGIALDADLIRYDADDDGMSDVFEDYYQLAKTDFTDAVADPDADGVVNHEEMTLLLSPNAPDTTSLGGLGDLQVLMLAVRYPNGSTPPADDNDSNGIPDWADAVLAAPATPDFYHFTRSSPDDLDGDALPDVWEHRYGRWRYQTNGLQLRRHDASGDADTDGYTNLFEFQAGSSPLAGDTDGDQINDAWEMSHFGMLNRDTRLDTDGDGFSDAEEYAANTDPLRWQSRPTASAGEGLALYTTLTR